MWANMVPTRYVKTRGDADAEATAVYAKACDQSPQSREFYEFLKTMETFAATLDSGTWIVLSSNGEFYKYLNPAGSPAAGQ